MGHVSCLIMAILCLMLLALEYQLAFFRDFINPDMELEASNNRQWYVQIYINISDRHTAVLIAKGNISPTSNKVGPEPGGLRNAPSWMSSPGLLSPKH